MKILLKNLIKFLLISSGVFVVLFFSIVLYHLIPFLKVGTKDIYGSFFSLVKPSFFHALYNSFVWSSVLFTVFILAKINKKHLLTFLIPIVFSSMFIFGFHLILKPTAKTLSFNRINDLRILFANKTFFQYKGYNFFFKNVKKSSINGIIIVKDNKINFVKRASAEFLEDFVVLKFVGSKNNLPDFFFPRKDLINYGSYISIILKLFIKWMTIFSYLFVLSKYFFVNIILWGGVTFFLVSFFDIFRLKKFLLLSFFINFLLVFIIYFIISNFYLFYKTIAFNLLEQSFWREAAFSFILLFLGLILFGIKILFLRGDNR